MALDLPSEYYSLLTGEHQESSMLIALLPPQEACPDVTGTLERLKQLPWPLRGVRPAYKGTIPAARWELEMYLDEETEDENSEHREFRLWVVPSERFEDFYLESIPLRDDEKELITSSRWSVGLSCWFGADPLVDYHLQLKLLSSAFPEAVAYYDASAFRARGPLWVKDAAMAATPPAIDSLFSIHTVTSGPSNGSGAWMHTHGLIRCGYPELEMFKIPEDAVDVCGQLMNVVAALILDSGMPEPAESFWPGVGIELLWLPAEKAVSRLGRKYTGDFSDRDEIHSYPSAVLFAPRKGLFMRRLLPPSIYKHHMEDNPLLYYSNSETQRMSELAKERFSRFRDLFSRFGSFDDWLFVVKLGYLKDDPEDEFDREHLWFRVETIGEQECKAVLLNQPYALASMQEGQEAQHDLSLMSDWRIHCPLGEFSADTVIHLQRLLKSKESEIEARVGSQHVFSK